MKSPYCRRSPHKILTGLLLGLAVVVCTCELRAGQPKSPTTDDLAKRTLRALGEAAAPIRPPRHPTPPLDELTLSAAEETTDEQCLDTRPRETPPLEPAPLAEERLTEKRLAEKPLTVAPLPEEPPNEDRAGWYSKDRTGKAARPVPSKPATSKTFASTTAAPKTARNEAALASVRWADARGDDGEAVRPAADWRGATTVTLRGTSAKFNPLRNGGSRDEDAFYNARRANPLRAN